MKDKILKTYYVTKWTLKSEYHYFIPVGFGIILQYVSRMRSGVPISFFDLLVFAMYLSCIVMLGHITYRINRHRLTMKILKLVDKPLYKAINDLVDQDIERTKKGYKPTNFEELDK